MNIAILHGGISAESAISTKNAVCAQGALHKKGHNVILVNYEPQAAKRLLSLAPDAVFIAVQGPGHGDGVGQAICEFLSLPYTGTRSVDAAVINNKALCKTLALHAGITTPDFAALHKQDWEAGNKRAILKEHCQRLGLPLVGKIVDQGGSFGLAYVADEGAVAKIDDIFRFGDLLIFEQYVSGTFFTLGVLEGAAGPIILPPVTARATERYDDPLQLFNRPYANEPMPFSDKERRAAEEHTLKIYRLFNCRGYARIDFMRDAQGAFQFIEVNAVPGLNEKSLFPFAASLIGIDMPDICDTLVQNAVACARAV